MAKKSKKNNASSGFRPASLHIKKNTAGTSNELSLSVMDALSKKADAAEGGAPSRGFLGGISLFTFPGKRLGDPTPTKPDYLPGADGRISGSAPSQAYSAADIAGLALDLSSNEANRRARKAAAIADPEAEISRRKKMRRVRRALATAVGIIASVAVVGAFGTYLYKSYEDHAAQLALLHDGIAELEQADEVIVRVDELIASPVTEDSLAAIEEVQPLLEQAQADLDAAENLARRAGRFMLDGNDKEACNQLEIAVQARRDMLAHAGNLMAADANAAAATDSVEACWELVLQGDALAREAAELVTDTTVENVQASQAKSEEALELFRQARVHLDDAASYYASADLSVLRAYIDKRIEAMGYAIASDEAIYIQDKQTADSQNALYNEADAAAAELAAQLPENPSDPIVAAYEANIRGSLENYKTARTRAGTADAFLRDYLGESAA